MDEFMKDIQEAAPHCYFCNGTEGPMERIGVIDSASGATVEIHICEKCVPGITKARTKNMDVNEGTTAQKEQNKDNLKGETKMKENNVVNNEEAMENEEVQAEMVIAETESKAKKILKWVGGALALVASGVVGVLIGRGMSGSDDDDGETGNEATEG